MPIELYACGFNAHGQLTGNDLHDEPQDVDGFQSVLKAKSIRVLFTGWSDTLLEVDGELLLYGFSSQGYRKTITSDVPSSKILYGFGDHTGLKGAITVTGTLYLLRQLEDRTLELQRHRPQIYDEESQIQQVAIAGNGRVCVSIGSILLEFSSLKSFLEPLSELPLPTRYVLPRAPTHLLSGETSFIAVLHDPTPSIYTWGDARHNHLGRVITPNSLSATPQIVDHLGGIPIKKVSTGGWITAALSTSNDLYLWGGRPGEEHRIKALPDISRRPEDNEEVKLVDIDGGIDVLDVSVGAGHIVALTADGRVWTVGRGHNGQLGYGAKRTYEEDWIEIDLHLEKNKNVEAVYCGPCSSFLLVRTGV